MDEFFIMTFDSAISSLKQGEFVMIHDSDGRENEIDLVTAAQFITPEHIARMRQHAGGLICLAIDDLMAQKLQLSYMHDILSASNYLDSDSKKMIMGTAPYGDHPTFSIHINHKQTYTGITDMDRALTIKEMANLYESENPKSGDIYDTSSAYLTFVSLNENGKPKRVDNINPENDNEIRRFKEGKVRHEERKERLIKDRK